jgi:hypothetical protein
MILFSLYLFSLSSLYSCNYGTVCMETNAFNFTIVMCVFVTMESCSSSCCQAVNVFSASAIHAPRHHITVLWPPSPKAWHQKTSLNPSSYRFSLCGSVLVLPSSIFHLLALGQLILSSSLLGASWSRHTYINIQLYSCSLVLPLCTQYHSVCPYRM